jgi:hypothetical protein
MPNFRRADAFQVNVKTLKNIAALACVTALAVPAGVSAKGPSGDHGKSGDSHGNAKTKVNKRCKHTPRVGFNVKGTVVSYDAATKTIVVDVADKGVSRHAKKFVTDDPLTATLAKAPKTDPAAGSNVVLHGKIDKPKKKCNETDDAIAASVVYTRVTPDDKSSDEQKPEQEQPTS